MVLRAYHACMVVPRISPEIFVKFPTYQAASLVVTGFVLTQSLDITIDPPDWLEPHIAAWQAAFKAFGATPKKTMPSVEALWRRYRKDGGLPNISPLVNVYNALSLNFGAPFGGEDLDRYQGMPQLVIAQGGEPFDTSRDGEAVTEGAEQGEVIWRDDLGVTCRRWNWRQCKRTALHGGATNLWFVIDRLDPMPVSALASAADALRNALLQLSPSARVDVSMCTGPA